MSAPFRRDAFDKFEPVEVPALWDPHDHLREDTGDVMVVGPLMQASYDGGAVLIGAMPNTAKGLLDAGSILAYQEHCDSVGPGPEKLRSFTFLQITPQTTTADIDECCWKGFKDAKVYPLGRTTESQNGVRHYNELLPIIIYACRKGMRVHFHPEHPSMTIENRDAEYMFLSIMDMIMHVTEGLPGAIVWEHGTDMRCIPSWREWAETGRFFVTLTAHHLVASENETFGDVAATCKPPIKTRFDQKALVDLVKEGLNWVMAGTDSAAHDKREKQKIGQCACGAYTAPFAMALYAHALRDLLYDEEGTAIFIKFTSGNARSLYGDDYGDVSDQMITIRDESTQIPDEYEVGTWNVIPFMAGKEISCQTEWAKTA